MATSGTKRKNGSEKSDANKTVKRTTPKNKESSLLRKQTSEEIRAMQAEREAKKNLHDKLWGLILIAVGALIFAAIQFHAAGKFGNAVGELMKGIFGLVGLILPWFLLLLGILLITHKARHFSGKSCLLYLFVILMLCLINSGRFITPDEKIISSIGAYYTDGITLSGGGFLGMSIGTLLARYFGKVGLYIIGLVGLLIGMLLLLNTPLNKALKNAKNKREEKRILKEEEKEKNARGIGAYNTDYTHAAPDSAINPLEENLNVEEKKNDLNGFIPFLKKKKSNIPEVMTDRYPFKDTASDADTSDADTDTDAALENIAANSDDTVPGMIPVGVKPSKSNARYRKPPIDLLNIPPGQDQKGMNDNLKEKARILEHTLQSFGVNAHVARVTKGPAITRFEVAPEPGVKVQRIVSLADDIALNLKAKSIRMEAPIPGKAAVGIEVENDHTSMVYIREIIVSREFKAEKSKISFALGKDIAGRCVVTDLMEMPHLLIAGSTGSGKSVCINSLIASLLYKANPDEVKLMLIDPKVVELGDYNGIPHLLVPVVTDPSKAAAALNWAVVEMTNRYKLFAKENARNLKLYNQKMTSENRKDEKLPQVVIIIDELADLMMASPKSVEESICRLAQLARAAGMHLVVATQRPSVDVITGLIKANIPSRIAFAVSSQVDSRTILDGSGAEKLVGKGDMIFAPLGGDRVRVQGSFISDEEVRRLIEYVKSQVEQVEYSDEITKSIDENAIAARDSGGNGFKDDELLRDAAVCVINAGKASTSMIQRRFRIGYNRAAGIMDTLEERGIVGPSEGSSPRKVLITEGEIDARLSNQTEISSVLSDMEEEENL